MSAEPTLTNGQSNQAAQQVSPRPPKTPAVITSQPSLGAAPDQQPPKSTGSTSHPTCSDAIPAIAPSPTLESDRGSQSHASPTTTLDPRAEEAVTQADIRRESHGSDAGKSPSAHVVPVESPLGEEAPEQRAKPAWRKWLAEICYCVISLLSLIIIVAVLRTYQDQALPSLPMDITLNTFLAFFTTSSKVAFMVAVNECLGQWKWNLASRARSTLYDFDCLDTASRGPWGALMMIRKFRWRHMVTAAGFLSLISVLTSPITQNMISYNQRVTQTDREAAIMFSHKFLPEGIKNAARSMFDSTSDGSDNRVAKPIVDLGANCGTNNCTFEPFSSLALCMKHKDISHMLTVTEIPNSTYTDWSTSGGDIDILDMIVHERNPTAWKATLAPAIEFDLVVPVSFAFYVSGMNTSLAFTDPDDEFTAVSHIYAIWSNAGNVSYPGYNRSADPKPWEFRAVEFLFHLCVNTYSVSYQDGKTTTSVLSSSNVPLRVPESEPIPDAKCGIRYGTSFFRSCDWVPRIPTVTGGTLWLQDPHAPPETRDKDLVYGIDHVLAMRLEGDIMTALESFYMWDGLPSHQSLVATGTRVYARLYEILIGEDPLTEVQYPFDFDKQFKELGENLNGMAISITNMFRSTAPWNHTLAGVAWEPETYVAIHWGWAAFLAVELLISFAFLAVTVYATVKSGAPVLKTSALATVMAASTNELGYNAVGSVHKMEEARERSKTLSATLENESGRLALG